MLLNLINSKEVTWVNAQQYIFIHCQLHLFYLLIYLIIVMQHYIYIYIYEDYIHNKSYIELNLYHLNHNNVLTLH